MNSSNSELGIADETQMLIQSLQQRTAITQEMIETFKRGSTNGRKET